MPSQTQEADQSGNIKKALTYLGMLYGESRVNIVAIDPHTEFVTGITRSLDDPEIESFIAKNIGKQNLYYSVNGPKEGAPDNKLKKEHVGTIHAVWIDADPDKNKSFKEERERLHKLAKELVTSDHPPTVITDSGGGIQAFWFLETPVPVTPETKEHYEGLNRALAQKYGTDNVHNIDRIMRLPYTWNIPTKKKKGRKRALAKSTRIGARYKEITFIEPVMAAESDNDSINYKQLDWKQVTAPLEGELADRFAMTRKINQKIDDLWTGKINMKPSRSERDFTLAKELKSQGFTLNETGCIMRNFPHGKGKELTKREIVRCYERSGNDFVGSLDAETIDRIANQVNPILAARAAGKFLEEDLNKLARFRSVELHKMNWRDSGRPIYRDFLYEKAITVIYGKSNTGKSFLGTEIAGHVALGRDWNGMEFEGLEPLAILYICAEAGQSFGIRGKALMARLGVKELPFFVITEAPSFTGETMEDAKEILAEIKRIERENNVKIGLVVVDTLAVTFQGDENSAKDMGAYVNNMKYIQHHADTGIIVVHHSGKDQLAGARGSSALQAATDTEMEVKIEKNYRQVEVKKQRTGKAGMVVKFNLSVKDLGKDDRGKPLDSCYVVVENDAEFEFPASGPEDGLDINAKCALSAIRFYHSIPDIDNSELSYTEKQVKTILFNDFKGKKKVFDENDATNALLLLADIPKPDKTVLRAFERCCDKLATNGFTREDSKFQLLSQNYDTCDKDAT
jgi:hypothetical protein